MKIFDIFKLNELTWNEKFYFREDTEILYKNY